jgi:hypothetical protein
VKIPPIVAIVVYAAGAISVIVLLIAANTTLLSQWLILSAWLVLGLGLFFFMQHVPTSGEILGGGMFYVLALPFSRGSQKALAQVLGQPSLTHLIYFGTSKVFLVGVVGYFGFLCVSRDQALKRAERELEESGRGLKYFAAKVKECENLHLVVEPDDPPL